MKDKAASTSLIYDKYPRSSLIDHFFTPGTQLKEFADGSYLELGDFADKPYESSVRKKDNQMTILLQRKGRLEVQGKHLSFEMVKEVKLTSGKDKIEINYTLRNTSNTSIEAVFGSEWNINLLGGGHNEQAYYQVPGLSLEDSHLDSWGELAEIERVILGNKHIGMELEIVVAPKVGLWRFPVESISNSEGGIERIYKASCLVVCLPFKLPPGGMSSLNSIWRIQ